MARVDVAVTGLFIEPRSGDPATGVVRFLLPQPIISPLDGFTIEPVEVEAALDLTGRVDIVLSTVSGVNAVYVATVSITGADPRRFEFVVPASGDPVDLAAVQPIIPVLTDVPAHTTDSGPFLRPAANLSDVASAGTARTNLGLGSAATQPTSAFDAAGAATTAQTAERTRALAAEAVIVTSVTTEATRATAAEAALASSIAGSTVSDATATSKGIVQLAGDLAGTADAPTVPGLAAKADSSALAAEASRAATAENQALRKTSNLADLTNASTARSNLGLGSAATQAATDFDAAGAASAAQAASQPVDADLTAIAALSTTSFGRSLLALADAAAGRSALALGSAATASVGDFDPAGVAAAVSTALAAETSRATAAEATAAQKSANLSDLASASSARSNLGLGSAATQPSTAFDAAGAAAAAQAASQPLDSDLTAIAALATTAFGRGLLALADAAAGRTALGLGSAAVAATTDFDSAGAAAAAQAAAVQRSNHTGTQLAGTISDFTEAAQDAIGAAATDSATLDLTYDDAAGTISGAVLDSPKVGGVAVSGTPSAGNVITALSAGAATWSPVPSAPVSSVNGRTGAVTGLAEASALATETSRATAAEALALLKSANLSDLASAATARTNLGLGSAATQPSSAFDAAGAAAAAQAASQPVDSDLSAIAALSTTSFGRSLLALVDGSALAAVIPPDTYAGPPAAADAVLYVSTLGNDANSGRSWDRAKLTVQAAIDAAPASGGTIEVSGGVVTTATTTYMLNKRSLTLRARGSAVNEASTTWRWTGASGGTILDMSGSVGCKVEGIGFFADNLTAGSTTTQTAIRMVGNGNTVNGVVIGGCFFNTVERCYFQNFGTAVDLGTAANDQVDTTTFRKCFFYYGPSGVGVTIRSSNTLACQFDACTFSRVVDGSTTISATGIDCYNGSFSMTGCLTAANTYGVRVRSAAGNGPAIRDCHSEEDTYPVYVDGDGVTGSLQFASPFIIDGFYAYFPKTALLRLGSTIFQYRISGLYADVVTGNCDILVPDDTRCVEVEGTLSTTGAVKRVSDGVVVNVKGLYGTQGPAVRPQRLSPNVKLGDSTIDEFAGGIKFAGGVLAGIIQDVGAGGAYIELVAGGIYFQPRGSGNVVGLTSMDLEVLTAGKGTILKSPAGNRFRVTVDDDGVIDTVAL